MAHTETAHDARVVMCTFPSSDVAATIGRTLVTERLAACINLIPNVRSIYTYNGNLCDDAEVLAVIKTTEARLESLTSRLVTLHPYECPEVLALAVAASHKDYLSWLRTSVGRCGLAPNMRDG